MPKGKYLKALTWIALNDDTEFLDNGDPMSVTLALVADLWGRETMQAINDLKLIRARLLPTTFG